MRPRFVGAGMGDVPFYDVAPDVAVDEGLRGRILFSTGNVVPVGVPQVGPFDRADAVVVPVSPGGLSVSRCHFEKDHMASQGGLVGIAAPLAAMPANPGF